MKGSFKKISPGMLVEINLLEELYIPSFLSIGNDCIFSGEKFLVLHVVEIGDTYAHFFALRKNLTYDLILFGTEITVVA